MRSRDRSAGETTPPPRHRGRTWIALLGAVVVVLAAAGVFVARRYHLLDRGRTTPVSVDQAVRRYQATVGTTTTRPSTSTVDQSTVAPSTVGSSTVASPTGASSTLAPAISVTSPAGPAGPNRPSTTTSPATAADDGSVAARLPSPGVYLYATTGRDSVDALNGDHHDYPATTTITVTSEGCGVRQRWDVATQRWSDWQRCPDEMTIAQPGRQDFDQFFGQDQLDAYSCTGESRPVRATAGTTWTATCTDGGGVAETHHGTVIGAEQRTVGDTQVDVVHVRVTIDDDVASDSQVSDTWYLDGTDLIVAQHGERATTSASPVGDVHYRESYEIDLTSLTPLT